MKNIIGNLCGYAIRKRDGKVYYFDENGLYRCVPLSTALQMNFRNLLINDFGKIHITQFSLFSNLLISNQLLIKKAIAMLREGDTLETFDNYLSSVKFDYRQKPEGINRFILRVDKPIFVRIPENPNENTFDYIRIMVNVISEWNEDRKTYIGNHIDEINQMIINKLESNKQFQSFNIPINFIKVSKLTFSPRLNILEYVFELKEVSS